MEFCSHIARHFAKTPGKSKVERARIALAHMGSSVSKVAFVWKSVCCCRFADDMGLKLPVENWIAQM